MSDTPALPEAPEPPATPPSQETPSTASAAPIEPTEPTATLEAAAAPPAATPGPGPAECAALLKQHFPALFAGAAKPLKLRIQADIQQRLPGVFSKAVLSAFLRRHTGSTAYLIALSKGTQRFDLDGQPAGELAGEHRQAALQELARRRALHDERRALEDTQRLNRAKLLHDWERTTLTRPNFCALKGVADDQLDALLERARAEAAQRPPPRPAPRGGPGPRGPQRPR